MSVNLRKLDDRFVPGLARRTRAAASYLRDRRARALAALPRRARTTSSAGGRRGPAGLVIGLRRVDDRWARRGPLALLRELPQVGGLLLAILVLVNGGVVLQRAEPRSAIRAEDPAGGPVGPGDLEEPVTALIGPDIGDNVPDYIDRATLRLKDRVVDDAKERSFAVVSFERYLTPTELVTALADVGAFRVYFRVPAPGLQTEVEETGVKRLVPDVLAAYARVATQRRADVAPLLEMARTTEDPEFKSFYEATAKAYQKEIEALSGPCACVFGAVTVAGNDDLGVLSSRPGVRLVDIGPRGATFDGLTYRALLPEERVTVTGGNEAPAELPAG